MGGTVRKTSNTIFNYVVHFGTTNPPTAKTENALTLNHQIIDSLQITANYYLERSCEKQ